MFTAKLLDDLPPEVRIKEIYPYLSSKELYFFSQTCKQIELETWVLRVLPKLLSNTVNAEPESDEQEDETKLASIAFLKRHPELLFERGTVVDHVGRKIEGSIYQLLLGASFDGWALRQVHKEIIPKIVNGEAQAQAQVEAQVEAQFKKQFPNCPWPLPENFSEEMLYDDRNKQQIKEIAEQVDSVKWHLGNDPLHHGKPLDATKQAVVMLCKLFKPKLGEVIRSGLHFPLAIMKEVLKTYDTGRMLGCGSFFSREIIKPALDALSTVDGQCCRHGLNYLDMEKGPSRRCHSSYQHPLGKPLSLSLVDDKDKHGMATLVDPVNGDVIFYPSLSGHYFFLNKNGTPSERISIR